MATKNDLLKPYLYIDTPEKLEQLCALMKNESIIGFDTEADSLHHYEAATCLIQISFDQKDFILDPLALPNLDLLWKTLPGKELIIHGSDYDLRMMKKCFDYEHDGNVFDTMIAVQFINFEKFGLADLVSHYADVQLSKELQKADWSKRPLTDKMIHYALSDTKYLIEITEQVKQSLIEKGRLSWVEETCEALKSQVYQEVKGEKKDRWRVKGCGKFEKQALHYVRAIWGAREEEAKEKDRPPFKIMSNQDILRMATELFEGKEVSYPKHIKSRLKESIEKNLAKALKQNEADWPELAPKGLRFKHAQKEIIQKWREKVRKVAEKEQIPAHLILSRTKLEKAVIQCEENIESFSIDDLNLLNWQKDLLL